MKVRFKGKRILMRLLNNGLFIVFGFLFSIINFNI